MQPVGRVEYTAAAPRDLLVTQAVDFVQKLLFAASGVDQMGVRVAERRKEHATLGVDRLVGRGIRRQIGHAAEGDDPALFGREPCVVEGFEAVHVGARHARTTRSIDPDDRAYILNKQFHTRSCRNRIEALIWGYITWSLSTKGTRFL